MRQLWMRSHTFVTKDSLREAYAEVPLRLWKTFDE
jgi:hypothetical protein